MNKALTRANTLTLLATNSLLLVKCSYLVSAIALFVRYFGSEVSCHWSGVATSRLFYCSSHESTVQPWLKTMGLWQGYKLQMPGEKIHKTMRLWAI